MRRRHHFFRGESMTEDFESLNLSLQEFKDQISEFRPKSCDELQKKLDTIATIDTNIDLIKKILADRYQKEVQ